MNSDQIKQLEKNIADTQSHIDTARTISNVRPYQEQLDEKQARLDAQKEDVKFLKEIYNL